MPLRLPLLAAGLLFVSFAAAAPAPKTAGFDWPAFRGPNRDGVSKETGLLKEWPKEGPPVAWTVKGLGLGFGTPTVAKGMIFGMGTRDGKDGIWALAEADGKELWFTPFDDPRTLQPPQNNGPSASPTYDDGKVFAVSSKGKLVGLDAAKGDKLWERDYVKDFGGKVPTWGFTDSVLIDGDKLVCVPGGATAAIVALDKKTGKDIWKSEIAGGGGNGGGYCSPQKVTLAGKPMIVVLMGKSAGLVGVDSETGKLLWDYKGKAAGGGTAQIPIPIVTGDSVWVSCAYDGGSALLQIAADGTEKFAAKEVKAYKKLELCNHHGGMVQIDDYAYFGHNQNDGKPVCVDLKRGDIKWGPERASPAGGGGSAAVLVADGRLYFRYDNGTVVLIEPSPEKLKVVSSFKEAERSGKQCWPHPVIANGKLYLRDQDKLTCYDVKAK